MLSRNIVLQSLRNIRDRFFDTKQQSPKHSEGYPEVTHDVTWPSLDDLSVDMQFHIMTFLSPQDLCRLGGTSTYWRSLVRDPLLWKYFLLRDMPLWRSVDHLSMPDLKLNGCEIKQFDYMAEYLRICPACRNQWRQDPKATFDSVTSFFQSFVAVPEPQFAMFGPGLEQLEFSLLTKIIHSPDILPIAGIPQRQIDGVGSGISFKYKEQHRFSIVTLYSTNRTERERARLEHRTMRSKLFVYSEQNESLIPLGLNPMLNQVCQAVNGFIFVANAEMERADPNRSWEEESAQIRIMLDAVSDSVSLPILVLSCVSREAGDGHKIPCVTVAEHLQLSSLSIPWMVQNTTAETLTGLLDGIDWLLRNSGVKV